MPEHKDWLSRALDDLDTAKMTSDGKAYRVVVSTGMFHTQQCAEKSLKAYLAYKDDPLRRIHDLVALLNLCKKFDDEFEAIRPEIIALNPYLCNTRYPEDCFLMPDVTTLRVSIKQAEKIYYFVYDKIYGIK